MFCCSQIFQDENKFDAIICENCYKALERSFMLIKSIREYENEYFEPRRNKNFRPSFASEFGFKVCRTCLSPEKVTDLKSMFNNDDKLSIILKLIAGVDVSLRLFFSICNLFSFSHFRSRLIKESTRRSFALFVLLSWYQPTILSTT